MKRWVVVAWASGAAPAVAILGCGGSTSTYFVDADAGAEAATVGGGPSDDGGAAADSGSAADGGGGKGGGSPFDPGSIGGLIGGAADAGAAMADAAGAGPAIRPEVVDGCNALCAQEATANCPNQGTAESCVLGCRLLVNNPACATPTASLFACEKTSAVSCDAAGKATLTQCPIEQLGAVTCFLQSARDPSLNEPCMTYCANVAAAHCPNDDVAGCPVSCQVVGNFIPDCNVYWKAYIACSSTSPFACGADGKAGATACIFEFAQYAFCTLGGALNTGDAGR